MLDKIQIAWEWVKDIFGKKETPPKQSPEPESRDIPEHIPPAVFRHLRNLADALERNDTTEAKRLQDILDNSGFCRPTTASQALMYLHEFSKRKNG